jgi:hypothetical protein
MEAAIYSTAGLLLVSSLSGLAYLAVKYPLIYVRLGWKLLAGAGIATVLGLGVSVGLSVATSLAAANMNADQFRSFSRAVSSVQAGGVVMAAALFGFGFFLHILAKVAGDIYRHDRRENSEVHDDQ